MGGYLNEGKQRDEQGKHGKQSKHTKQRKSSKQLESQAKSMCACSGEHAGEYSDGEARWDHVQRFLNMCTNMMTPRHYASMGTGKRLSCASFGRALARSGMSHLCGSMVAGLAVWRDNLLATRCEYPIFALPPVTPARDQRRAAGEFHSQSLRAARLNVE